MSAEHTPGPWVIEEGHIQRDSGGIRYWQITDGQDAICCNAFCYAGFVPMANSANARLISAAPDLLEALRDVENRVEAASKLYHDSTRWHEEDGLNGELTLWDWIFMPAVSAIAKAVLS